MTKEEVLDKYLSKYFIKLEHISHGTDVISSIIYQSMEKYAKDHCISFGQWLTKINSEYAPLYGENNRWCSNEGEHTTEELYSEFLIETSNK